MQVWRESQRVRDTYQWKVCLLALCLLNAEDVRIFTFDVFHTSILKKRGEVSTKELAPADGHLTFSHALIPFTFQVLIFFVQGLM